MDDLTAFLAARLDEDELLAKRTESGEWTFDTHGQLLVNQGVTISKIANLGVAVFGWHIARHDPARVLREVAFGRALLAEHAPGYPTTYPKPSGQPTCGVCHAGGFDWEPERWPCVTVRALTAVYSDHLDYRPEWKP